jgi:hypothetical protein
MLKEKNKRHVGYSPNIWKKVFWSDETKIELFGHQGKHCLVQTQHLSSLREHHPHSEAWWWQHHDVGIFFISRDWETGQN